MPIYNVTVQDVSPMIQYSDGWVEGNGSDGLIGNYSGGTFHDTKKAGATATFQFYGTACYLYGAKRSNHGQFSVTLDGVSSNFDGHQNDPGEFQTLLFSNSSLPLANHTLVLTNGPTDSLFVDLDWIDFTTGDDNPDTATNTTLDDPNPAITYLPSDTSWQTLSPGDISAPFLGGTVHFTTQNKAQAIIKSAGNAFWLFGTTSTNYAPFTVSVDGGSPISLNASTSGTTNNQALLYYASGLGPGTHEIAITNVGQGQRFDLDYVVTTSFALQPAANGPQANQVSKAKTPIIAGAVSGSIIGLAWIIAMVIFFFRRKKRRFQFAAERKNESKPPDAYILPPDPAVIHGQRRPGHLEEGTPGADARPPVRTQRSKGAEAARERSYYLGQQASGSQNGSLSHNSVPRSVNPPSSDTEGGPMPQLPEPSTSNSTSPPSQDRTLPPLPASTGSTGQTGNTGSGNESHLRLNYSPEELAASRMQVADRAQDWGPVREEDFLPPNYQQATEPMPNRSHHRLPSS